MLFVCGMGVVSENVSLSNAFIYLKSFETVNQGPITSYMYVSAVNKGFVVLGG